MNAELVVGIALVGGCGGFLLAMALVIHGSYLSRKTRLPDPELDEEAHDA